MIGGYIKNAMQHPAVGTGAGALIGYHAMGGSLFAGLLMAGTIGTYLQGRKMQKATDAARAAAIAEAGKCEDPNDPACVAKAKAAAVRAGQAALAGGRSALHLPIWASAVIAALVTALIVLATMK